MMQIGNLQPEPQAFPNASPAEADKQQQPCHRSREEERQEPLFVSPPPAPWPRVFPGL